MDWIEAVSGLIWSIGFLILVIRLGKPAGAVLTAIAAHLMARKALDALKVVDEVRKLVSGADRESSS